MTIDAHLYDFEDYVALDAEPHVREHTQEAIKQRGEVFTPDKLVKEMLDKLPSAFFADKDKTFLDNSCGNGQFLSAVLDRKMANGITHEDALKSIYGVELDSKNSEECRLRLLKGSNSKELRTIVDHNIICADALDANHKGWADVGFYWEQPIENQWFDAPKLKRD